MSEEEKKAIEQLKYELEIPNSIPLYWAIDNVLKLVEKQEKENKELTLENQALYESINCNDDEYLAKKYSKLKEVIEKQQKEIEEKDKYIKAIADIRIQDCKENYSEVIDKYFISKDKIREKIKEIDKEYIEIQERQVEISTFMKIAEKFKEKKDILKELLEEE